MDRVDSRFESLTCPDMNALLLVKLCESEYISLLKVSTFHY